MRTTQPAAGDADASPANTEQHATGKRAPTRYRLHSGDGVKGKRGAFRPRFHNVDTVRWLISEGMVRADDGWLVASCTEDGVHRIMHSARSRLHAEQFCNSLNDHETLSRRKAGFEVFKKADLPWALQTTLQDLFAADGGRGASKPRQAVA